MAKVECASVTVGRQKPQTSHGMPPIEIHRDGQQQRRDEVVGSSQTISGAFEKSRMTGLVGSSTIVLGVVQEPADVGVVEAADHRAVRIAFAIGEAVMVHVMAGPPERPLLHRRGADERPDEAGAAVHLERAVREVAMERQRQADRPQEMRDRPQRDERPRERDEEDEKRRRLDDPEHDNRQEFSCATVRLRRGAVRATTRSRRGGCRRDASAFFFVLFFFGRAETGGRAECFAVVVERQVAHVERQRAGRRLLVDDHGHRAAFDAFTEGDAAAAGESRVRESLQHPSIISRDLTVGRGSGNVSISA